MEPRIVFEIVETEVTFSAKKNYVVAVINISDNKTIGLRFTSVDHLLDFCSRLIEKAALTWPENEYIKEYLSE